MKQIKEIRSKILRNTQTKKILQRLEKFLFFLFFLLILLVSLITYVIEKKDFVTVFLEVENLVKQNRYFPDFVKELFLLGKPIILHLEIFALFAILIILFLKYISFEDQIESNIALNSISGVMFFTFFCGAFYHINFFQNIFLTLLITFFYIMILYHMKIVSNKDLELMEKKIDKKNTPKKE